MSYDYPRNTMSRGAKMRGAQPGGRDSSSAMQINRGHPSQAVLSGSVAILWDMENCPVPSEVKADDVAGNVRLALRSHPIIQGAVAFFSAYGDFNHFPKKVREGCQRTGVNLIDVPNGKKDASDKAILVDMFLFALDNPPPCTIFLISGDVDFAPALHKLGQRGYTVVLAIPSGVGVSSALCSAGRYVWDWPLVARGQGLVPAKNVSNRGSVDDRMAEFMSANSKSFGPGVGGNGGGGGGDDNRMNSSNSRGGGGGGTGGGGNGGGDDNRMVTRGEDRMPMDRRNGLGVDDSRMGNRGGGGGNGGDDNNSGRMASRGRAVVVEDRMAEIIDFNRYPGPSGPVWGPSDNDSDLANDDPTPDEEEKIVWKSPAAVPNRFVDHAVPESTPTGSKLDFVHINRSSVATPALPLTSSVKQLSQEVNPVVARELGKLAPVARAMSPIVRRQTEAAAAAAAAAAASSSAVSKGSAGGQNLTVQVGNLQVLKEQLLKLLSFHGSKLELMRVPAEYQKQFGVPLAEYGNTPAKLSNLLEKFRDCFFTRGEGMDKTLHLTKSGSRAAGKLKKDATKGGGRGGVPVEEVEVNDMAKSPRGNLADPEDEVAGEEVIAPRPAVKNVQMHIQIEDQGQKGEGSGKKTRKTGGGEEVNKDLEEIQLPVYDWDLASGGSGDEKDGDHRQEKDVEVDESTLELEHVVLKEGKIKKTGGSSLLDMFKVELQELLVSHACKVLMTDFVELYEQRYSRILDYGKFGVQDLEALIKKVSDVAVMMEESGSNQKFLVAS